MLDSGLLLWLLFAIIDFIYFIYSKGDVLRCTLCWSLCLCFYIFLYIYQCAFLLFNRFTLLHPRILLVGLILRAAKEFYFIP